MRLLSATAAMLATLIIVGWVAPELFPVACAMFFAASIMVAAWAVGSSSS